MTENEDSKFVFQVIKMLDSSTRQDQQQFWVVERLHRICSVFRESCSFEPCLEQYENHVQMILDDAVTPAASAWIELIVQSLRSESKFQPDQYIR